VIGIEIRIEITDVAMTTGTRIALTVEAATATRRMMLLDQAKGAHGLAAPAEAEGTEVEIGTVIGTEAVAPSARRRVVGEIVVAREAAIEGIPRGTGARAAIVIVTEIETAEALRCHRKESLLEKTTRVYIII